MDILELLSDPSRAPQRDGKVRGPDPGPSSSNTAGSTILRTSVATKKDEASETESRRQMRQMPRKDLGPPSQRSADQEDVSELDKSSSLLVFYPDSSSAPLEVCDDTGSHAAIAIALNLSGLFFGSNVRRNTNTSPLVCYRRNMFQVEGTISMPNQLYRISSGVRKQIVALRVTLEGRESWNGEKVKLVKIPGKPKNQTQTSVSHSESAPAPLEIDLKNSAPPLSGTRIFRIFWPRLQFRTATSKHGRRKDKSLDQYFKLTVHVEAILEDGTSIKLYASSTAPIIVRGRSPQNFNSPKPPSQTVPEIQYAENPNSGASQDNVVSISEAESCDRDATTSGPSNEASNKSPFQDTVNAETSFLDDRQDWDNLLSMHNLDEYLASNFSFDFANNTDLTNYWPEWTQPLDFDTPEYTHLIDHSDIRSVHLSSTADSHLNLTRPLTASTPALEVPTRVTNKPNIKHSGRYEYIPLDLEDRTPPVQAIYVSNLSLRKFRLES